MNREPKFHAESWSLGTTSSGPRPSRPLDDSAISLVPHVQLRLKLKLNPPCDSLQRHPFTVARAAFQLMTDT